MAQGFKNLRWWNTETHLDFLMCSHHPTNLCLQQFVGYPRSGYGEYRVSYSPPIHDRGRLAVDFHWGFTSESGPQQWTHHEFWNVWNFLDHDVNLTVRAWLTAYGHSTWDFTPHFGKVQQGGVIQKSCHLHDIGRIERSSSTPAYITSLMVYHDHRDIRHIKREMMTHGGVRGGQAPKTMSDQLMNSRPGGLRIHDGSAEYRCWWMETDEVGISTGAPSPRAPSRWTWLFVYQTLWRNRLIGWTGLNKVFICDVQIFCNNNCWAETPTRSLLGDLSNWVVQIAGICWPLLSYSLAIWILRLFQPGSRWWRVKKKRWKKQIRSFGMPYLLPLSAWTFHHWTIIHLSGPVIYLRLWSWQMLAHWPEELWLIRSSGEIPTRRQRWIRIRIPQVTAGGRNMTWRKEPAPKIACIIRLNWDEVRKFDMCMYIW